MRTDATSPCLEEADALLGATAQRTVSATIENLGRLQRYARALLDGVALPEEVDEDWPTFFRLAGAFAKACGSPRLQHLRDEASLFEGWGEEPLTDDDRAFLVRLLHEVHDALHARDPKSENAEITR